MLKCLKAFNKAKYHGRFLILLLFIKKQNFLYFMSFKNNNTPSILKNLENLFPDDYNI